MNANFNSYGLAHHILTQNYPDKNHGVYYVLVHKESDSGLMFNQRMLIIVEYESIICYSKVIKPYAQLLGSNAIKRKLRINEVGVESTQNSIVVSGEVRWKFKFGDTQLCEEWRELVVKQQEIYFEKSIKSKDTKTSSQKEQYPSILQFTRKNSISKVQITPRKKIQIQKIQY